MAKYGDQINFVPFIVETGGRINAAGLKFFDTVSGALEGDTAKVRAARRAALYGVKRVGQAAGLHVGADRRGDPRTRSRGGDVGGAGVAVSGDDDVYLSGYAHHHAEEDADLSGS